MVGIADGASDKTDGFDDTEGVPDGCIDVEGADDGAPLGRREGKADGVWLGIAL